MIKPVAKGARVRAVLRRRYEGTKKEFASKYIYTKYLCLPVLLTVHDFQGYDDLDKGLEEDSTTIMSTFHRTFSAMALSGLEG